jgi:tetratricopeptide (TPR) repeat protein
MRHIYLALFSLSFSTLFVPAAQATDLFKDGCQLYANRDYQRAARYFSIIIRSNKKYWPAYYQLANTYLALQEYELAKKYYEECIEHMPDYKTAKSCKLALDHIAVMQPGSGAPAAAMPGPAPDDPKEDPLVVEAQKRKDLQKEEAKKQYEKELEISDKRKSDLLSEAMKKAAAIRAEAQQRIQDIHDNGNQWVRNPESGEVGVGVSQRVYDDITNEAEERAKKIIDEAELRARGIQKPREPDWDSFKVHPSSVPRKGSRHHR